MSAAPRHDPGPALRFTAIERSDWWRCRLRTPEFDGVGTVTGLIMLGVTVTSYEIRFDNGSVVHAWPACVGPAAVSARSPRFAVIDGGREE